MSQVFCSVLVVLFRGLSLKFRHTMSMSKYQLISVIYLKAVPQMENTDEIVFGRTDEGPLSQSCPVCKCLNIDCFYSV